MLRGRHICDHSPRYASVLGDYSTHLSLYLYWKTSFVGSMCDLPCVTHLNYQEAEGWYFEISDCVLGYPVYFIFGLPITGCNVYFTFLNKKRKKEEKKAKNKKISREKK